MLSPDGMTTWGAIATPLGHALVDSGHLLLGFVVLTVLATVGLSLFRLGRRRASAEMALPGPEAGNREQRTGNGEHRRPAGSPGRPGPPRPTVGGPATPICAALYRWLGECEGRSDLWSALDQLIRELLSEHLGASRVRCYHVRPGCDTLATIAQHGQTSPPKGPSVRDGVLGHVITTGREFIAHDDAHGPLLESLAAQGTDAWAWVWPIGAAGEAEPGLSPDPGSPRPPAPVIGVVAVANLHDPTRLTAEQRQTVGQLLSIAWQQVSCLERLRVLRRTDPASGVLTRHDFFTLATHALADSYREHEPVVVAVLALEGLRRLDDTGHWRQRDALIEQLGPVMARRVRSDDLVGRFADDRFVLLLRRLDSALGRLIAEKVLAAATQAVCAMEGVETSIRLRMGLAGSGLLQPSLEDLLVGAFQAVEEARRRGAAIGTDLPDTAPQEPRASARADGTRDANVAAPEPRAPTPGDPRP